MTPQLTQQEGTLDVDAVVIVLKVVFAVRANVCAQHHHTQEQWERVLVYKDSPKFVHTAKSAVQMGWSKSVLSRSSITFTEELLLKNPTAQLQHPQLQQLV